MKSIALPSPPSTVPLKAIRGVSVSRYKDSMVVVHHEQQGHDSALVVAADGSAGESRTEKQEK